MPHSSSLALLAVHGLRLKGRAEAADLAALWSTPEAEFVPILAEAEASEFVIHRDGRMAGWYLTSDGRAEDERLLSEELDEIGARQLLHEAYNRFLALNRGMLEVCTRWQVKDAAEGVINDHSDPEYDAAVIAELADLDEGVQPIVADLLPVLGRFSIYPGRFSFALDKVRAGEQEWFTKPIMESYHTVWFELHEDLLATLGIDRATEGSH